MSVAAAAAIADATATVVTADAGVTAIVDTVVAAVAAITAAITVVAAAIVAAASVAAAIVAAAIVAAAASTPEPAAVTSTSIRVIRAANVLGAITAAIVAAAATAAGAATAVVNAAAGAATAVVNAAASAAAAAVKETGRGRGAARAASASTNSVGTVSATRWSVIDAVGAMRQLSGCEIRRRPRQRRRQHFCILLRLLSWLRQVLGQRTSRMQAVTIDAHLWRAADAADADKRRAAGTIGSAACGLSTKPTFPGELAWDPFVRVEAGVARAGRVPDERTAMPDEQTAGRSVSIARR